MCNPWILRRPGAVEGRLRMLCLPHAGSGAAAYLGWAAGLDPAIELIPVQLPGRESRLGEPAMTSMAALVPVLADALGDFLHGDRDARPYVLYGHSMGAFVAFELALEFRRRRLPLPAQLLVTGARAPHLPPLQPILHTLPDTELLQEVSRRYAGSFEPEMMDLVQLMLPTLRADLALVETRRPEAEPPLPLPLAAWAGANDDFVPLAEARQWGRHTAGEFEFKVFSGGHFFPSTGRDSFLAQLARLLVPLLAGPGQ